MPKTETNPIEIIQPRNKAEKIAAFLQKGSATKDLIARLCAIDPTIILPSGKEIKLELSDVMKYIEHEIDYANTYYPSGYRYLHDAEANRKRIRNMEQLFKNRNYAPLIKILLNEAVRSWNRADRMDKRAAEKTPEERAEAQKIYEDNIKKEREISKRERETGKKEEHGFPPQFLEVGGVSDRRESQAFLSYAAILAKEITKSGQF